MSKYTCENKSPYDLNKDVFQHNSSENKTSAIDSLKSLVLFESKLTNCKHLPKHLSKMSKRSAHSISKTKHKFFWVYSEKLNIVKVMISNGDAIENKFTDH